MTTAKIKKAEELVAAAEAEYTDLYSNSDLYIYDGSAFGFKNKEPFHRDFKCPKCNAEADIYCKWGWFWGRRFYSHPERIALYDKELIKFRGAVKIHREDVKKVEAKIGKLKERLRDLKEAQFIKNTSPANKKSSELTLEWNGHTFTVVKYKNINGIDIGGFVPGIKAAEALMKKGVDVTIINYKRY